MKKQTGNGNGNGNGNGEVFSIQSSVFRRVRRLTDLNTEHRTLNTLSALITVLLLAGTAQAATKDWVGTTSTNMSTAANWSPTNVPGSADIARWNSSIYPFQPSLTAGLTIGQLLFGDGNSGAVTIGGSQTLTLNRLEGVGIQMTNGAVTINAPITVNDISQSFINNNPSGFGALTFGGTLNVPRSRLTVSGSGDTITSALLGNDQTPFSYLTMNGTGKLTLGGSVANTYFAMIANSGTVLLNKDAGVNIYAIPATPLLIGQANTTPALVQYTGNSANMIADTVAVTLYGAGQLDFNGKSDTIGTLTIYSAGASGDSTAITNSGSGGTLTSGGLTITPRLGYNTTIDSGTGTNKITADITPTFTAAGSGTARISGNLHLNNQVRLFNIGDGEAANDMVIDAVIIGGGASGGLTKDAGNSRLVLGGSNDIIGFVNVRRGILTITNSSALGTASGVRVDDGSTSTLELQGNIAVGALPLELKSAGTYAFGALRNVSGNNSWGGAITLSIAAAPINSEKDTLTLQGAISGATFGLTIGGAGNTTITNVIGTTSGTLTKNGGGTLTLSGANTFTGATTVNDGTLVLDYSTASSRLNDAAALNLAKGTIQLSGGTAYTEIVGTTGGTILNAGHFAITRPLGTSVLAMNAITRSVGSTIDFGAADIATTDLVGTGAVGNRILGGWATVAETDWARNTTEGGDGSIVAYAAYTANTGTTLGGLTTDNSDMSSAGGTSVGASTTINSIRFNNATPQTITMGGAALLTVTSGGILETANVLGNANVITGGPTTVAGGIAAPTVGLTVHQYNSSSTLTIDSVIGNTTPGLTKSGPGTLVLGGGAANLFTGGAYVNGGELDLNKSAGTAAAIPVALTINQTGIVKYINAYGDQIGAVAIAINENGQLDFNGKSDTVGAVTINSSGASGNTCPITNSTPASGNLTIGALSITPLSGYETAIDTGSGGTNTLSSGVTFTAAGNGTARISGNLNLGSTDRTFTVNDGDAYNDMVIDAVISGTKMLTKTGAGRLVLGGANTFTNTVTVSAGILTLTNGSALGTADGLTTVSSVSTLELRGGNITVPAEPLTLSSVGVTVGSVVGGLRNVSGDNTWGGPVTLGAASRINSDSGTLLIANTLNLATFGLTVGSYGNVTLSGVISGTAGTLTKEGLGTLTLAGASANTFTNLTTITEGTLELAKTAGVAVSNLTVTGSATYNGAYGLVRYAANSGNNQISGTVTLNANARGAGQLDFNGSTDTVAVVTINSTTAIANSRPIVNTGNGGLLTINSLTIVPGAVAADKFITTLDSGSGTFKLGGSTVTCTAGASYGQAVIAGALDLNAGTRIFDVIDPGATRPPIYDLGISAVIANGALTKTGAGRLYLSGVNTYAGDTLVSAGTLLVAASGSISNSPNVTVAMNATLQTDNASALGTNAALALVSDQRGANYGKANLNFVGTQTVAAVRLDGVTQSGTWGSTSSTAANKNNNWFSGTGVVLVNGPQIQNEAVTNVSETAATFNGWLVSNGPATVGVLWGTADGGISGAWANTNWFDGTVASGTHLSTNISLPTPGIPYYYTFVASNASVVVRAAPSVTFVAQAGTTKTWLTTGTTDWGTGGNWTPAGAPDANCNVIINTAGGNQPVLNLSGGPFTIKSLTIGAIAASTLTFTNGNVDTKILIVTNDVTIGPNGILTHAAETSTSTSIDSETQRLFLNVGGNMAIALGGKIDVTSKGYVDKNGTGSGPGVGSAGGSAGGYGGQGGSTSGGTTYGSVTNPVNSGSSGRRSGGTDGRAGGGTARLNVGGMLTLNGSILADGYVHYVTGSETAGGGSGGSVNIVAGSLSGNGTISANGGGYAVYPSGGSAGGGGRVAVVLTNADNSAFAGLAAVRAYAGLRAGGDGTAFGAPGTVYLKGANQTYGTLIVNANGVSTPVNVGSPVTGYRTTLSQNYTNLFDTIIVTNAGIYALGANSVLDLSTGCALRSPPADTATRFMVGGSNSRILWPPAYTFTNVTVSWTGTSGMAITSDVTVAASALLTHEGVSSTGSNPENHRLIATIDGNLTVASGGKIDVTAKGYLGNGNGPGASGANGIGGHHGGQGSGNAAGTTYGSVTNPVRSGSAGGGSGGTVGRPGGGAAVLTISGELNVYGSILADGSRENLGEAASYGSGGSVNIVAGTLSGSGTISANGGAPLSGSNPSVPAGGGGRVAVVLTNAIDSAFAGLGAIRAYGGVPFSGTAKGAAGTVYLKAVNNAYGRLIVDNNGQAANLGTTLLNASTTDKTVGDVMIRNNGRLTLSAGETLTVNGSWSNAVATNAFSGGTVVLAGTSPATVWGGNTWSNLTITTAGKQVQFQTNVIQYVYGVPAWSNNVTLKSTEDGTYWKLFKPSWGATQDVGVVNVQWSDALVNTGATFRAAVGSTVSPVNTRNWTAVTPKGTVIMMR